jgi:hypothetical protein
MSEKKERPILFSTEMVQAILAGRKTQTRRVIKPQPPEDCKDSEPMIDWCDFEDHGWKNCFVSFEMAQGDSHSVKSPYGKVGDLLWVRETWAPMYNEFGYTGYKADDFSGIDNIKDHLYKGKWKPSIHMPKSRARIFLEITEIKAQRLQDISEEDAKNEGISITESGNYKNYGHAPYNKDLEDAASSFMTLWWRINGMDSWDANPWVWVIKFKVIKP